MRLGLLLRPAPQRNAPSPEATALRPSAPSGGFAGRRDRRLSRRARAVPAASDWPSASCGREPAATPRRPSSAARAVQRHHQRELPVGQSDRPQRLVETARHGTGGALHVQAEARVAHEMRGLEGDGVVRLTCTIYVDINVNVQIGLSLGANSLNGRGFSGADGGRHGETGSASCRHEEGAVHPRKRGSRLLAAQGSLTARRGRSTMPSATPRPATSMPAAAMPGSARRYGSRRDLGESWTPFERGPRL